MRGLPYCMNSVLEDVSKTQPNVKHSDKGSFVLSIMDQLVKTDSCLKKRINRPLVRFGLT